MEEEVSTHATTQADFEHCILLHQQMIASSSENQHIMSTYLSNSASNSSYVPYLTLDYSFVSSLTADNVATYSATRSLGESFIEEDQDEFSLFVSKSQKKINNKEEDDELSKLIWRSRMPRILQKIHRKMTNIRSICYIS